MKSTLVAIITIAVLAVGCGQTKEKQAVTEANSISYTDNALKAEVSEKNEKEIKKAIVIGEGIDDYFGNNDFMIENYVEEIDHAVYQSVLKNYASTLDKSEKIDKINGKYVVMSENKSVVVLKDVESDNDDRIIYEYVGFIPKIQSYLFNASGFEGWGSIIISKKDGSRFSLRGEPYFSSDNKLLCTLRVDEEGETYGSIEVFDGNLVNKKLLYGLWSYKILPEDACWDDKNDLYIKAYKVIGTERIIKYYKLNINK